MLSKLKFKCEKCGEKVDYESIEKHMEICDKDNMNDIKQKEAEATNIVKKRFKRLTKDEAEKAKKGGKLPCITCKNISHDFIFINIVITLGIAGVGKSSLINT